jgi:hypothetical protein
MTRTALWGNLRNNPKSARDGKKWKEITLNQQEMARNGKKWQEMARKNLP